MNANQDARSWTGLPLRDLNSLSFAFIRVILVGFRSVAVVKIMGKALQYMDKCIQ